MKNLIELVAVVEPRHRVAKTELNQPLCLSVNQFLLSRNLLAQIFARAVGHLRRKTDIGIIHLAVRIGNVDVGAAERSVIFHSENGGNTLVNPQKDLCRRVGLYPIMTRTQPDTLSDRDSIVVLVGDNAGRHLPGKLSESGNHILRTDSISSFDN